MKKEVDYEQIAKHNAISFIGFCQSVGIVPHKRQLHILKTACYKDITEMDSLQKSADQYDEIMAGYDHDKSDIQFE